MGATSVTGVGPGSADGKNKGSEHMTLGVHHLIGPHVIAAGTVELDGPTATVYLPAPPEGFPLFETDVEGGNPSQEGDEDDIVIQLTNNSSNHAYVSSYIDVGADGGWSFEITAGEGDIVWWSLIFPGR
jgi:hypothetical protein